MRLLQALLTLSLMGAIAVYGYTHARTVIAQQLGSIVRQHNRDLEKAASDPDEPEIVSERPTLPAQVALPWEAPEEEGGPLTPEVAQGEPPQAWSAPGDGPVGPADIAPPDADPDQAPLAAPERRAQADPEADAPRPWVSSEPPVVRLPPEVAQLPPRAQAKAVPDEREQAQTPAPESPAAHAPESEAQPNA